MKTETPPAGDGPLGARHIGFLGAGAIFRSGDNVQGLSTGASVWLAGAMGVACGGGFYELAALTTVLSLVVLTLLGFVQRHVQKAVDPDSKDPAPANKEEKEERA